MSFSSAARPGSYRKSHLLLSARSCSVSKRGGVLRRQLGAIAGLGPWVHLQGTLRPERTEAFLEGGTLPCEKWSCSGAVPQNGACRDVCSCCLNPPCSQVTVAGRSPLALFLRSVPWDGSVLMAGGILAGTEVTVNALGTSRTGVVKWLCRAEVGASKSVVYEDSHLDGLWLRTASAAAVVEGTC